MRSRGSFETVILKDGQKVTGEVVAEKSNALYIDLGYDLLRVPRDQVLRRTKIDETDSGPRGPVRTLETDSSGFYTTGMLKPAGVKDLVGKYGEAVISIETPSGKGSGFIINKDGYAITNAHVIQGETRVSAILYLNAPGGLTRRRIEDVEIVALNPFFDLALLKLPLPPGTETQHGGAGYWGGCECGRCGLRRGEPPRPGADGHAGDRQQSEPGHRGPDLPPDGYGDQPGELGRSTVQPAGRGDRRHQPGRPCVHGR